MRDEWRITTGAIELEMERIAGLLQKSVHFQSRTSAPHPVRQRHEGTGAPTTDAPEGAPALVSRR